VPRKSQESEVRASPNFLESSIRVCQNVALIGKWIDADLNGLSWKVQVSEPRSDGEQTLSLGLASLGQLCNLSLEERYASLLRWDRQNFESVLQVLNRVDASVKMEVQRLAWAVAYNFGGVSITDADHNGTKRSRPGYCDRWPLDTDWSLIWSTLVRPPAQDDSNCFTLLSELAWSVACEQRADWQHPSARRIDVAIANRAFEIVHSRNNMKVLGACRRFVNRGEDPMVIAHEAWSRVFCDYWSMHATGRFLGLSQISTLVIQVARHIAIDSIRSDAHFSAQVKDSGDDQTVPLLQSSGGRFDPDAKIAGAQLYSRAKECMSLLPPKRRIVAEMVWFRRISSRRAAQILKVSEPAISQHLKKARDLIGMCLKEHGFDVFF
jgi:RNA polymerase sigma factor (sigma-70 family)